MPLPAGTARFFAEEIRATAALPDGSETERVLDAFAAVPRERHAGPGPWLLRSGNFSYGSRRTPDADPAHLYHNVLIALDEGRDLNIGEPALWARHFARAQIPQGGSILQVGTGTGYFTAILAELAGPKGHVLATEIDAGLAAQAEIALADVANATVRPGNGATDLSSDDGPFDLIVAFAGITHPIGAWADVLKPGGRILAALTGTNWWGAMALIERDGDQFSAMTLGRCGIFPCEGARDDTTAAVLERFWSDHKRLSGAKILIEPFEDGARYSLKPVA
ncbi:MAG: methyltransferase domain-containing protein [Pseudomonadota bacterium]